MTIKSFSLFLFLLLSVVPSARGQAFGLPEVRVKLTLAEPRSVYKIGEPIKLILEFTADREGYSAELLPDGKEYSSDTILISPEIGVSPWLVDLTNGFHYLRDMSATAKLSNSPQRVELVLNDTLRFDKPGRYTVKVTTRRVTKNSLLYSRPLILTTNPIAFEIEPMSDADEAAEVKRLCDLLARGATGRRRKKLDSCCRFLPVNPRLARKCDVSLIWTSEAET